MCLICTPIYCSHRRACLFIPLVDLQKSIAKVANQTIQSPLWVSDTTGYCAWRSEYPLIPSPTIPANNWPAFAEEKWISLLRGIILLRSHMVAVAITRDLLYYKANSHPYQSDPAKLKDTINKVYLHQQLIHYALFPGGVAFYYFRGLFNRKSLIFVNGLCVRCVWVELSFIARTGEYAQLLLVPESLLDLFS